MKKFLCLVALAAVLCLASAKLTSMAMHRHQSGKVRSRLELSFSQPQRVSNLIDAQLSSKSGSTHQPVDGEALSGPQG
jgi:hypothetical protein